MNKVEKIKAEIRRLKNELIQETEKGYKSEFDEGRISAFEDMIIYINSIEEEPISNDLEKAAVEAFKRIVDSDKNSFLEIFKAGAQWGKEQTEIQIKAQSIALPHGCPKKEPVSKDLEYFAKKESESFAEREYEIDYIDRNALTKGYYWGVKAGAQWQKQQDQSTIELAEDHAMLAGMEKMKEEMMKDVVDGVVFTKLDDGSIMVRTHYFKSDKIDYLDEVKLIIIKEK